MGMIAENIAAVESRIAQACSASGRDVSSVRLLPVSKTHPMPLIRQAAACGYPLFGENKVQELVAKAAQLEPADDFGFSVIGHLQTNKAKLVAELADEFQALDSLRLARELDKRLAAVNRRLPVLLQVNTSREPQKNGVLPEQVPELARALEQCPRLELRGLMTVAVNGAPDQVTACFDELVRLQDRLRSDEVLGSDWAELSMGMSQDLDLAIKHGSTCVRVGTAIFGARDYAVS
ncbi:MULTISPECIES: YggS family pyridoxal phosphate-dependent enzyme [unclassified Luteococcus]|uniref:YggS family pyridoxal phosphate-dependent enzyme n=1 Tax=unclassified Luteococcus TaxID=2639923 RepID=UPI00313EA86F